VASRLPIRSRLTGIVYATAWRGVRILPERVATALFNRAADVAARRGGRGYTRLRANLSRVVGSDADLDTLTRAAMRSYARYWLEVFRFTEIGIERMVAGMRSIDEHYMRDSHAAGGGTILALPHMGNWEQAGAWLVATGVPFTTVAERLEPASLFDRFLAFRTSLGMEVIPLTGGERPPFEILAERLHAGGMLCLVADRDMTDKGVRVRFFSGTASMPAGPAALALKTGATLVPVTLWFDGDTWGVRMYRPIEHTDVQTMTQALADAFAEGISNHPADWHMLQRVFVDDSPAQGGVPGTFTGNGGPGAMPAGPSR
jgi:KDO2-lipid IV(A) lauroyltransferase